MYVIKDILVPTDFSEFSASAVEYASTLAQFFEATIHLLHVVEGQPQRASRAVDDQSASAMSEKEVDALAQLKKFAYWKLKDTNKIEQVIVCGKPHCEIIHYAKENEIDLIVIATHGRTGLAHILLGSVAEKVVRFSHVPVLAVKPREWREQLMTREDVEQDLHIIERSDRQVVNDKDS